MSRGLHSIMGALEQLQREALAGRCGIGACNEPAAGYIQGVSSNQPVGVCAGHAQGAKARRYTVHTAPITAGQPAAMRALTVHQPWAWALVHEVAGKNVENRVWSTRHRGLLAVHASGTWDQTGAEQPLVRDAWSRYAGMAPVDVGELRRDNTRWLSRGAIIGVVELVGVHQDGDRACGEQTPCTPWAAWGQYHWQCAHPRVLVEPVPVAGARRLWTVPAEVEQRIRDQLAA